MSDDEHDAYLRLIDELEFKPEAIAYCKPPLIQHPISSTGLLRDGDGTYRCERCGVEFNGRWLNHTCDA